MGKSGEPRLTHISDSDDPALARAYAWYHEYFTRKTADECLGWVADYARQRFGPDRASIVSRLNPKTLSSSVYGGARMHAAGAPLPADVLERLDDAILRMTDRIDDPEVSIARRVRDSASDLIGEVEGWIDDAVYHGAPFPLVYDVLVRRSAGAPQVRILLEKFRPQLAEVREATSRGADPDLRQAYAWLGRTNINTLVSALQTIVDDAARYVGNRAASRKPRRSRAPSAEKLARGLRFMRECPELRLVSIEPPAVMGASEAWTYDVKTRRLTRFVARTREGLKGRGVSIVEFDAERSVSKTLRKPEDVLQRVVTGGKRVLDAIMDELTTKGSVPSGRTSTDVVFLKAVK